ncbi:glycosyltransferase [Helcobacillus massiliensis]|uniref:glycosyltransferase n=1 Tax=Helcobacillus massiliensis TaxID=521392 RepID=UPI0021A9051C|nr:glycosyltransferase [Helcobacillus massiliensis]MCT1556778.1 glycosyltransferase [Helcobacillus massiliensis]MCT2035602.1 glycosyltransferase [Helcobacillus massiliensis]MCT2330946.1 glycosyltransferase [Helcobacillus massiliensis]
MSDPTARAAHRDRVDAPVASVIVPSYRGADRVPALLDSLAAQQDGTPPFEVIVVVDGVDDGTPAIVNAETRIDARAIVFPENRGRVAALNAGFDAARGDVLIRCDDDLIVPPGYISAHVRAHAGDGECAAVGLTRDIHNDSAYARAYGRAAAVASARRAGALPADQRWTLWAASCSVPRAVHDRLGGYSSAYTSYGWEDIDYGWRLHDAGIPIVIAGGADAEHHGPARSAAARSAKAFDSGSARALFHRRHPSAPLPTPTTPPGLWGRAVDLAARTMRRGPGALPAMADRAARVLPAPVARKIIAVSVEGAALAGHRHAERTALATTDHARARRPRIAIAHDYLTQRGGAERLVLSIVRAFPDAEVHTLFYEPDQTYPEYRDVGIRTSPLNRIGLFRRDPRLALPLLAPAASALRIDADLVIASSSGWAHAFGRTGAMAVYCHSPARWLYVADDYLGSAGRLSPQRLALAVLTAPLKAWDQRAARAADTYRGNSTVVRERIRRVYGIDAPTLFPPFSPSVADGEQTMPAAVTGWGEDGGHYLVVSRLQPYKHVDRVIAAFRDTPERRLIVIGRGPLRDQLRSDAPANVRLLEDLTDAEMRWAYAHARALIAASHEDFGLTPLEAGAHGIPTIALRAGGYLDTIREGTNGLFFEEPTPTAIRDAVDRFEQHPPFGADGIRAHAETFSEERFIRELHRLADQLAPPPPQS